MKRLPQSLVLLAAVTLTGCSATARQAAGPPAPQPHAKIQEQIQERAEARAEARTQRAAARTEQEMAREQLDRIPPPSKNRYLAVHSAEAWSNPFLSVHPSTVTLRIFYPDRTPDAFDTGGMLRPASARKQELEVRLSDLPRALAALPEEVWPYGRVVAVQEPPNAPRPERVAIRRNVEATIQMLNDLGIVVDEWAGPSGSLLR